MTATHRVIAVGAGRVKFRCPGCQEDHHVRVEGAAGPVWGWNGSLERPTFTPSIRVRWEEPSDDPAAFDDDAHNTKHCCHSFVTDGRIQFLGDSTHDLAGQTVNVPVYPAGEEGPAE